MIDTLPVGVSWNDFETRRNVDLFNITGMDGGGSVDGYVSKHLLVVYIKIKNARRYDHPDGIHYSYTDDKNCGSPDEYSRHIVAEISDPQLADLIEKTIGHPYKGW